MKRLLFVSLVLLSISCEETLVSKVCLIDKPCHRDWQNPSNIVVYQDTTNLPQINGICMFGTVAECDKEGNPSCVGDVIPSVEICDGLDNDCNQKTDETFDLDEDNFTSCGGDCDDNDKEVNPSVEEICDRKDNNCDGQIDNLTGDCWQGPVGSVFNELSTCKKGTEYCSSFGEKACRGQTYPEKESCDELDNDCDGEVDEREINICGPAREVGVCTRGDQICLDGDSICVNATYPSDEVCDNLDNNCDSQIDEGLFRDCQSICGMGTEICASGAWVDCDAPIAIPEICGDSIDNDCDGTTDNGCACQENVLRFCINNLVDTMGVPHFCGIGVQVCQRGDWQECIYYGTSQEACNVWDDDCDGVVDNFSASCTSYDPILAGTGVCLAGSALCENGSWSSCEGEVAPSIEVCDRKDNNCDGQVDENLNTTDKADIVFLLDISGSMCDYIDAIILAMNGYVNSFTGTEHMFAIGVFPGTNNNPVTLLTQLTDVASFINIISGIECNGGSTEPSYDAVYNVTNQQFSLVSWRSDAVPYVIVLTDEDAQSTQGRTERMVAQQTSNCNIGNCTVGDKVEIFIISKSIYLSDWDDVIFYERDRFFEIVPPSEVRYQMILESIFTNVCL